jgi:hypothetical protein
MEYMDPVDESDIENARQLILDTYSFLFDGNIYKPFAGFAKRKNKKPEERNNIVLVFRGSGDIAGSISVFLFDTYESAKDFCYNLNELKLAKGLFIYARHAEPMVEYEITKPLLISFDQLFEYTKLHNEHKINLIIRETLKKFSSETILPALKGLDKRTRELIMHSLPIKTVDDINYFIENSDKHYVDGYPLSATRKAQQKILNAVNRNVLKHEKGKFPLAYAEILKD